MGNLLILVIPLTLIIVAVRYAQLMMPNKYGPGKLPPGPPGRDHAKLLEDDRWNKFKEWNERYGWISFFF